MASLYDFSRKIASLLNEEKYLEALECFKTTKVEFTTKMIGSNEYIISDIIKCLKETSQFDAAFRFLDIYDVEINENTKERVLTSYSWLLYSKYKAENQISEIHNDSDIHHDFFDEEESEGINTIPLIKTELLQKIESAINLLNNCNSKYAYSAKSWLLFLVLKTEKKKPAPNWNLINNFCNLVNPADLQTDCSTIQITRRGVQKDMELASDKENWYAYKSKALMKLGKYEECFTISKEGLDNFQKFHYSNDVWFSRRIALAKKNMGNTTDTINELTAILTKRKEWFIQKELAEILFEENNIEEAFKYSIQAITNFGELDFKIDLLILIGKILKAKKQEELAYKHFILSQFIRLNNDWRIPLPLSEEINQFNGQFANIKSFLELKKELNNYWSSINNPQTSQAPNQNILTGIIKKILHDNERGKDGFITSNGNEYYFKSSANYNLTPLITIDAKVQFRLLPAPDNKKIAKIVAIR